MTNTLNTPIEALEYAYPIRAIRYAIRIDSGGKGQFKGGDGLIRELQVLSSAQAHLIDRSSPLSPYGIAGGKPGTRGANILIRRGEESTLQEKVVSISKQAI